MKFVEQQESTFEKKFITGPAVFNNILINPTAKEAQEYGLKWIEEDPVYTGQTEEGKSKVDIVVYGKHIDNPDIWVNFKLTLVAENIVSQKGKECWINFKGTTTWVEKEEDLPDWFKIGEYRKALKGEESFYKFITAFSNINVGSMEEGESILETKESLANLFKGKFDDLKFANTLTGNKVQLLCYVDEYNDKFYQKVYTNEFFKHWQTNVYLYESKEKKGNVEWPYYIDYITKVDPNSKFNPTVIDYAPTILTLKEVKERVSKATSSTPIVNTSGSDLPFDF